MTDEPQDLEQGERVAIMRMAPVTGDIQIIEPRAVGMVDVYQVVVRFPGGPTSRCPPAR